MAEEKKKTTREKKTTNKITLDKNELSEIITNALLEYDKKKEEQKVQEYYDDKKNIVGLKMFWKMLWNPKKYVNTQDANTNIVKNILTTTYKVFEYLFLGACLFFFAATIPWGLFVNTFPRTQWWVHFICFCISLTSLLISRVIRIMALDVERSKDGNFLITLLSLIISMTSMIIAIVA